MTSSSPPARRRPQAMIAALAASALLAAAACSGGSSPSSSSSTGPQLSLPIQGAPSSFALTQIGGGQGVYIWGALYDTLLYLDNKGRIEPNAAQSYAFSDNNHTLTLTLRKGMTFSSGAPVNAAAVKASLDALRASTGPNQELNIASVQAPDDSTVVINVKQPDGTLLTDLAGQGGVIADPATMNQASSGTDPVGSGPYTLDTGATVAGSTYTLRKRAGYWNAAAYPFSTIQVRVMGDRTAVTNALQDGQLNAGSVDFTQLAAVRSANLTITKVAASTVAFLDLADRAGSVLKPLGDVRVRQAINLAFDRRQFATAFLQGQGSATTQLFNPKDPAYDPALDNQYPFDVAKAKALLTEAGYPHGFSVTMPSLVTTKIFEPVIAQSLSAIGITVNWAPVPPQQQASQLATKQFPIFLNIYGLDTDADTTNTYLSPVSTTNPFASADPALTRLIAQADTASDPAAADQDYKQINTFIVTNAWFAPLFDIGINWVTAKGITFLGDGSTGALSIRNFGVTG